MEKDKGNNKGKGKGKEEKEDKKEMKKIELLEKEEQKEQKKEQKEQEEVDLVEKEEETEATWRLIDIYFRDNPQTLVAHHIDSYNEFFEKGIFKVFRENNPLRFIEKGGNHGGGLLNECHLYLGGKDGSRITFGKPVIYDDASQGGAHYMYPNDARLRNMTYGITIH
jgi:DNA-directed RNA polymerase II subunit RPB2